MTENIAVELRDVVKRFGPVTAVNHVSIQIKDGEFFSLLGPSGCGKTTTLRMIAGFEMPTEGEIFIGGEPQGYLPAHQRPVNTVFQHYALFPHMNVYQNVSFGLEMQGVSGEEIKRRVGEALELVHLKGMDKRRPKQLSGGQQQRVALARALVNHPKVLLLDEPLGALDLKLRKAMQVELKALQVQVGITFIYVTHDQEEALTMSDRIAVMSQGNLLQVGSPEDVYESPSSRFVADFIGESNYISGRITRADQEQIEIQAEPGIKILAAPLKEAHMGKQATAAFRPEKVQLNLALDDDINTLSGKVTDVVYIGSTTTYLVELGDGSLVTVRQQNTAITSKSQVHIGDLVNLSWPITTTKVFLD